MTDPAPAPKTAPRKKPRPPVVLADPIWERVLPHDGVQVEDDMRWEAFEIYRKMWPHRSIREVSRRFDRSEQLIHRWKRRYEWKDRISAWDAMQARKRAEEVAEIKKKDYASIAGVSRALLGTAASEMKRLHVEIKRIEKHNANLQEGQAPLPMPKISVTAIPAMAKTGRDGLLLIHGDPTERVANDARISVHEANAHQELMEDAGSRQALDALALAEEARLAKVEEAGRDE